MLDDDGLPRQLIQALEEEIEAFTFDTIVERLDQVFKKMWSYHYDGPNLVAVPQKVPVNRRAKRPRVFRWQEHPHWECKCTLSIAIPSSEYIGDISREYTVLVPADDDEAFCLARDLAFIYAAYYGLRVGKRSEIIFESEYQTKVVVSIGGEPDEVREAIADLQQLRQTLKLHHYADLDPLVEEWSNGELTSHLSITKHNVVAFTQFLKEKVSADG